MHISKLHVDDVIAYGWIAATIVSLFVFAAALSSRADTTATLRSFDVAVPALEQTSLHANGLY